MSKIPFTARALKSGDAVEIQKLMLSNSDYSVRITGHAPSEDAAAEMLRALPPRVEERQKIDRGLFRDTDLLALADLIMGWPQKYIAHIGLLMIHSSHHGQGLGRAMHQDLLNYAAKDEGITTLRISIVDSNREQAEKFWGALGYAPTGELSPYEVGPVKSIARIWQRPIR